MSIRTASFCLAICAAFVWTVPARAADIDDDSVMLVARRDVIDPLYGATVLIAKHIGNNYHLGLIVNRPTLVRMGDLFPGDGASLKVPDPVYLGGPFNTQVIFALVNRADAPGGRALRVTKDLFLAGDAETVDGIIKGESDRSRFFAGSVAWQQGELADEVKRGVWCVLNPEAETVLRKLPENLWEELVTRCESLAKSI